MLFSLGIDHLGRICGTLAEEEAIATVTGADPRAACEDFLEALDSSLETGYGECTWLEPLGEYRWVFKRQGPRLTVVVMWCSSPMTGWQHVFRSDCDAQEFEALARHQARALGTSCT